MNKYTFLKLSLVLSFFAFFQACQKDNLSNPQNQNNTSLDNYIDTLSTPNGLQGRLEHYNQILIWEGAGEDNFTGNDGGAQDREATDSDAFWIYVAELTTLVYQGHTLSATHIAFADDKAYVSYHLRGDEHLGALEVIDLSDRQNPIVTSQAFFNIADVNAFEIEKDPHPSGRKIWLALSDSKNGAVLCEMTEKNGKLKNKIELVTLSDHISGGISASANSVVEADDYLYVTSGKTNGGVYCLNSNDLSVIGSKEFSDAKYVATNGNQAGSSKVVSLQTGTSATLRVETVGSYDFNNPVDIGEIVHQNTDAPFRGKNSIHFASNNPDVVYVAMGDRGLQSFDISSGVQLKYSTALDFVNNGNTNGMASDDEYLYAANGADGLAVFRLPDDPSDDPELVFVWDLSEENASANFVQADGEWIFIAKGQGGLKILKKPQPGDLIPLTTYNSNGKPDGLEPDQEVCSTLLPNIFSNALPEGQNALTAHPEYFDNVLTNIIIEENSEVLLTFLHEGAGYKNTLGYYYYDADNPPQSEEDLVKIIIFPNASASGSGGELIEGNTMKLLGSFKENTVIGFFVIADGWRNGSITNGYATQYTNPEFNANNNIQSIIFHDETCGSTVVCFEDITIPGGDKDYNDAIFQITTTPASAVAVENYLQL